MSWWHWTGIGGGLLVGGVVMALLLPATASATRRLIDTLASWAVNTVRGVFVWLCRPGRLIYTLTLLGLIVAVTWALLASLEARSTRETVLVITQERDDAKAVAVTATERADGLQTRVDSLQQQLANYQAAAQEVADNTRTETAKLKWQQEQNAGVKAQLAAERAAAEASDKAWWRGYENRPDVCKAAQEAADVACVTVGEY